MRALSVIKLNSGRSTTSDTVKPTSHHLQSRTKQFTPIVTTSQGSSIIASIGSDWFQFHNTFMGWAGVIC